MEAFVQGLEGFAAGLRQHSENKPVRISSVLEAREQEQGRGLSRENVDGI